MICVACHSKQVGVEILSQWGGFAAAPYTYNISGDRIVAIDAIVCVGCGSPNNLAECPACEQEILLKKAEAPQVPEPPITDIGR